MRSVWRMRKLSRVFGGIISVCICLGDRVGAQVSSGRTSGGQVLGATGTSPSASISSPSPSSVAVLAPPAIRATAGIVVDGESGAVLWKKAQDRRLPPASTTKIATGLLLARDLPPDATIIASPNAAQTSGHSLGMQAGERFSARALLHALMLISANDASVAVAEHMAGSEAGFADRMNRWAQASGAPNTHFANASGLPAPGHYSTARDLATLARTALADPTFAAVVRTRTYTLPRSNGRPPTPLRNENTLLWSYPGTDGVKAGWTEEAGGCFVGSATRGGHRIITVLLHSPDWPHETATLFDYGFARLRQTGARIGPQSGTLPGRGHNSQNGTVSEPGLSSSPTGSRGSTGPGDPSGKVTPPDASGSLPVAGTRPERGNGENATASKNPGKESNKESNKAEAGQTGASTRHSQQDSADNPGRNQEASEHPSKPTSEAPSGSSSGSVTSGQESEANFPSLTLPDIVPPSEIGKSEIGKNGTGSGVSALEEKALLHKKQPGASADRDALSAPAQPAPTRRNAGLSFPRIWNRI